MQNRRDGKSGWQLSDDRDYSKNYYFYTCLSVTISFD